MVIIPGVRTFVALVTGPKINGTRGSLFRIALTTLRRT
jgi:hypothetical protein